MSFIPPPGNVRTTIDGIQPLSSSMVVCLCFAMSCSGFLCSSLHPRCAFRRALHRRLWEVCPDRSAVCSAAVMQLFLFAHSCCPARCREMAFVNSRKRSAGRAASHRHVPALEACSFPSSRGFSSVVASVFATACSQARLPPCQGLLAHRSPCSRHRRIPIGEPQAQAASKCGRRRRPSPPRSRLISGHAARPLACGVSGVALQIRKCRVFCAQSQHGSLVSVRLSERRRISSPRPLGATS